MTSFTAGPIATNLRNQYNNTPPSGTARLGRTAAHRQTGLFRKPAAARRSARRRTSRRTPVPEPHRPVEVMHGAEPFAFPGGDGPDGRTGVLLVHGFTGTPMSMRPWGEHLAAEGFAVSCPLLPGHGTRWQACNTSTHDQWTTAVGEAFDALA